MEKDKMVTEEETRKVYKNREQGSRQIYEMDKCSSNIHWSCVGWD